MRRSLLFAVICSAALSSCGPSTTAPAKLPPVAPLAKPSLPSWIASVSPVGKAESLAQIRVIFAKPVAKVEALSGTGPTELLSHLSIDPPLRGRFVLLTPRMIGFVAEQALPTGTRVAVKLTAGLRDLDGDSLGSDLAWTFETAPLEFSNLPLLKPTDDNPSPAPVGLRPAIKITANAAVDTASLAAHATLEAGTTSVPVTVTPETPPTPPPGYPPDAQIAFDPSLNDWTYDVQPQSDLKPATTYDLRIAAGVEPAYGNVATSKAFAGGVRTYDPLVIVPTPSASPGSCCNRFEKGDPAIDFNNPLDAKSIVDAVTISPAPVKVKNLVSLSDDKTTLSIDPYALDPNATYTATIAGTVKDTFGQTLGSDKTVTITTSDFAPGAWAPTGISIVPAGATVELNFYATNLPGNRYNAAYARMTPDRLLASTDPLKALPDPASWAAQTLTGAKRNVQSVVHVPLQSQLGGPFGTLAYGFRTALDSSDSSPSLTGIAQLTNLGIFSQWFPARGIVLVQHLSDGAPAPGVKVTAYRFEHDGTYAGSCAQGTTDANGETDFTGVDVERCYAGASSDQAPAVGVAAAEGADFSWTLTQSYSGIYRFDVNGGWSSGAPLSRGTIFPDRDMYQPGETGRLTGVAYYVGGSRVVADRNAAYALTLKDPSSNTSSLGTVTTDAYGIFSLPIAFSKQQAVGYYTVTGKGANGNEIDGSFRVAEFKPPNFKMALTLSATSAAAGSTVNASANAAYLFGAPLQGGTAHAYVTRELAVVAPKGWDDYWFGRQWFEPEQTPSFDTDVLQQDLSFDAQGNTSLAVSVPSDLPFPMTYTVDMEATDVSNLSVSDTKTFLALPADATIGITSDAGGVAGRPMPLKFVVTDADGHAISGRSVHFELQKMTYTSATQEVAGGEGSDQSVSYDTVATADATSGDAPATVNLTPTDVGPYRVRANFSGAASDASATDYQVFAFGAGEADWGLSDPNAIALKLDKKSYAIGDTANAMIAVPFESADVYVSVVRGDTLYRTTLRGVSGAQRIPFKVTQDMLPNAAIEAVVVRRGSNVASVKPGSLKSLARVGMAGFAVDTADRYLKLGIAPKASTVEPGGAQSVSFALAHKDGTPARGELVTMVVNDAILQLSGYRLPDLVQTVFAEQPISTIFSDNRENVVLKTQTPSAEKGFGYGGGFLAGAGNTRVRQHFLPLAFYRVVKTDASGNANVSFTMPDDLTTWRVMAVAIADDDAHFVTADSTFISTLPVMANPLLPQFARPGDRFDLGASVSNQTGNGGALDVILQLTGALAFAQGDPSKMQATEQAATGMQAWRFPVAAGTPAPTTVQATARLGQASDAFKVPFSIVQTNSTDSVIESGATATHASVPIDLNRGGWVQVTLANSVVGQIVAPSEKTMTDDALPLADDAASRLQIATALQSLRGKYRLQLSFDPAAQIAANLQRLYGMQRGDGGLAPWQDARDSDPFDSAYGLEALAFAREHGVFVDAAAGMKLQSFVEGVLSDPSRFRWCDDALCKAQARFEMLWALAANGTRRTDFLADIVAQSDKFDSATRIRVARYLLQTPGWQNQGAALADRLLQSVYLTGRYASANVSQPWTWLGSISEAQAQMLQLLLERKAPVEQTDGAVRQLIAQQCRCGWPTLDDTAEALKAIVAYAATERLSPGSGSVTAGGATVASAQFGSVASQQTFNVAASSIKGGSLDVASSGGATLHYTIVYTYQVPADAPGELSAFRVVRTVAEPGPAATPLATMDLAATSPLDLTAGRVFDVGVQTIVDHPVDRLVIEDPLPAGFEAVDTTFKTTPSAIVAQSDSWDI
ncbi:MAG: Ig-like domain-containing protein, partial [Candidatus Eremiobacteraeota bacterium]|nr:Ig-like domain-containing protein [Candidatus Eremiobacteraeota bacterium]